MTARRLRSTAQRLWQVSWRERFLLGESVWFLAIARLIVVFVPFRRIARLTSTPVVTEPRPATESPLVISRVGWAVGAASARVPWRALCFEQSLAAHFMLRRRRIVSVLHCGAAPDQERGLRAHVWLRAGDVDVVGGEVALRFADLASFPPRAA